MFYPLKIVFFLFQNIIEIEKKLYESKSLETISLFEFVVGNICFLFLCMRKGHSFDSSYELKVV